MNPPSTKTITSLKNSYAFTLLELLIAISISTLVAILCFKLFFSSTKSLSFFTNKTSSTQIHSFVETLTKDLESTYFDAAHPIHLTTDASSNTELTFHAYINGTLLPVTYQVENGYLFRKLTSPITHSKIPIKNFNFNILTRAHNNITNVINKWIQYSSKNNIGSTLYFHFQLTFRNKNDQPLFLERSVFPMINLL